MAFDRLQEIDRLAHKLAAKTGIPQTSATARVLASHPELRWDYDPSAVDDPAEEETEEVETEIAMREVREQPRGQSAAQILREMESAAADLARQSGMSRAKAFCKVMEADPSLYGKYKDAKIAGR